MTDADRSFDRLAARLLAVARALASARRAEARRWRDARLLWPHFGKD